MCNIAPRDTCVQYSARGTCEQYFTKGDLWAALHQGAHVCNVKQGAHVCNSKQGTRVNIVAASSTCMQDYEGAHVWNIALRAACVQYCDTESVT